MSTVGIPQGLFYHYYYPLWKTFFEDLGASVICSGPSNRSAVEKGIAAAVDESCFPVKVFFGHVQALADQKVDYLFLPRLVSVEAKSYICPKFMGVPDMIKAAIPDLPPIIDTLVDISKKKQTLQQEIEKAGRYFSSKPKLIAQAYQHGLAELERCRQYCRAGYTTTEAIDLWQGKAVSLAGQFDLTVGVLGHGYSLYDRCISMDLINVLRKMGCRVRLVETCEAAEIEREAATLEKRVFWTLGRKSVGAALHMEKDPAIDGIIYLACFGCGPDSMIGEIIERKIKNKSFMMMTIDEHTGEAGMHTRLEAFCDMLRRRRKIERESQLSPHGEYACSSESCI